jgi:uncharacterized protein
MAENPNWAARARSGATAVEVDQGLRTYMLGVYNYMATGLAITGLVAWIVSNIPSVMRAIFTTPLQWVVFLAPLFLVFYLSARIHKMSVGTARATFFAYAGLIGVMLSAIFLAYTGASITATFFTTAASFGALSIYGYTTKRDLSPIGSFLIIGLVGLIIAMVVNMFLHSPGIEFAISAIGVLIFAGLTAFDTQRIKEMYFAGDDVVVMGRKSILGALRLYLDFINLFLFLLRFMGNRR